jgi:hypothetical protein
VKQARKRAPGGGRKADEFGRKDTQFSLRIPRKDAAALTAKAEVNGRSLSSEILRRLRGSLNQERVEADQPPYIRGLTNAVAWIALGLQQKLKPWNQDRDAAGELAKGIAFFLRHYPPGETVVPPSVDTFPTGLGEMVASGLIMQLEITPEPPAQEQPRPFEMHESWWGIWQMRQDLKSTKQARSKPRRHK